ncbi:MAG: hypothetical protein IMW91_04345 [Firmicutes bacterium]|nr:hypothetical protein [Bacillota bacterium]
MSVHEAGVAMAFSDMKENRGNVIQVGLPGPPVICGARCRLLPDHEGHVWTCSAHWDPLQPCDHDAFLRVRVTLNARLQLTLETQQGDQIKVLPLRLYGTCLLPNLSPSLSPDSGAYAVCQKVSGTCAIEGVTAETVALSIGVRALLSVVEQRTILLPHGERWDAKQVACLSVPVVFASGWWKRTFPLTVLIT